MKWGFDSTTLGSATFYDMFSAQFVHKLKGGDHIFWVISDCRDDLRGRPGRSFDRGLSRWAGETRSNRWSLPKPGSSDRRSCLQRPRSR